jgi:hypothetical protein
MDASTQYATSYSSTSPIPSIIGLVIGIIVLVAMWRVFTKAGKPGWAAIVPIYNAYVLITIAGKPGWWLILYFVPIVNIVIMIMVLHGLSTAFGQGVGFTIGLILLPWLFLPLLGFGGSSYTALPAAA